MYYLFSNDMLWEVRSSFPWSSWLPLVTVDGMEKGITKLSHTSFLLFWKLSEPPPPSLQTVEAGSVNMEITVLQAGTPAKVGEHIHLYEQVKPTHPHYNVIFRWSQQLKLTLCARRSQRKRRMLPSPQLLLWPLPTSRYWCTSSLSPPFQKP